MNEPNDNSILNILSTQYVNYPSINEFIIKHIPYPSTVFMPTILMQIDDEFDRNPNLLHECYSYIELVNLLSFQEYGKHDMFISQLKETIMVNRLSNNFDLVLGKKNAEDVLFNSNGDGYLLLDNNPAILAIYLFATVKSLYFLGAE